MTAITLCERTTTAMYHGKARHAKRHTRWVGPLFALEATLVSLAAMREARATFRGARS